eukprot:scaffold192658_cov50-Attheya_sp.AAC.1
MTGEVGRGYAKDVCEMMSWFENAFVRKNGGDEKNQCSTYRYRGQDWNESARRPCTQHSLIEDDL